ncbi:K(+)-transporting ATPase subunit C [Luteolibacter flavescens]|uniref:Potassium-transporting ATPase KdpC subunit n=1 Tax=Luteolibacter flavescens TaxID=1859460 RepID=A0ABT3FLR3_9BACT|nr:K(+)-transporting ATPase subunit C [Luteolibacter flavescens]MCW1884392.1 K(+)-transporting ATPase subunit C [Luteolibacter flavescens]
MNSFLSQLRSAAVSTAVLAAVTCGAYPLIVTGISRTVFTDKADGSLIKDSSGKVVGSSLIGQTFTGEKYFHPRPSAAGANGYDGASSSGTNLGPTSQKLADQVKERVAAYRITNGLAADQEVPADAVTASGSGLDPHISPANAALQASRVAKARNLPEEEVRSVIDDNTDKPDLGIFGEPRVNVLKLNLALDSLGGTPAAGGAN